jgi:hypothetical protein
MMSRHALAAALLLMAGSSSIALAQESPLTTEGVPPQFRDVPGVQLPEQRDRQIGALPPQQSQYYGAIAFTADGSWATAWKASSKAEAEAKVAVDCAKFGRGSCEVVSFEGNICVGLATFVGSHSGRRYRLSFTSGGTSMPEAQQAAMARCNNDSRTRGRCQLRTVVCGDGR